MGLHRTLNLVQCSTEASVNMERVLDYHAGSSCGTQTMNNALVAMSSRALCVPVKPELSRAITRARQMCPGRQQKDVHSTIPARWCVV